MDLYERGKRTIDHFACMIDVYKAIFYPYAMRKIGDCQYLINKYYDKRNAHRCQKAGFMKIPTDIQLTTTAEVHSGELVMSPPLTSAIDPMEGVLYMLARCSAITLHGIVARQRQTVERYVITVHGQRAQKIPYQFVAVTLSIHCVGSGLNHGKITYAFELFHKYCPVHALVSAAVPVTHHMSWEG